MARVWLARVDDSGSEPFAEAVRDGLAFLGETAPGPWRVVLAPAEGLSKEERLAPGVIVQMLRDLAGSAAILRGLPRGAGTSRYQLSVAAPGERIEAHEDLFGVGALLWFSRLRWCAELDGVGGALDAAARALLPGPLDGLDDGARAAALGGLLEVGDPDRCIGDGRLVALGAAASAPRNSTLGLVVIADSAVAHDLVWAAVLGVSDSPWLRGLADRGLGPASLDAVELGGEDLGFFQRRMRGLGTGAPTLMDLGSRFQRDLGVALPIEVLATTSCPAARRAHAWLSAHTEDPERREALKTCPPLTLVAGSREPGSLPTHDLVLALGPVAASSLLSDVRVSAARRRPVWLAVVRGSSAVLWDLTLVDGRRLTVADLPDAAPSVAQIGRAAAVLTGCRDLRYPRESRVSAIVGWVLRRIRRSDVPAPLVHARRISRLQTRPWRQAHLLGPPLREDGDG